MKFDVLCAMVNQRHMFHFYIAFIQANSVPGVFHVENKLHLEKETL